MEKKRIYQVAKEYHISSEALVSMLHDLKFEVKSHMSVVDDSMIAAVHGKFARQQDEALKDIEKRKKISEAIDKRETAEKKPATAGTAPEHKPAPTTTVPQDQRRPPQRTDARPYSSGQRPSPSGQRPGQSGQSGQSGQRPAPSGQRPSSSTGQRPPFNGQRPSSGGQRPAPAGGQRPYSGPPRASSDAPRIPGGPPRSSSSSSQPQRKRPDQRQGGGGGGRPGDRGGQRPPMHQAPRAVTGTDGDDAHTRSRHRKRRKKVDQAVVQDTFKKTIATIALDTHGKGKKTRVARGVKETETDQKKVIRVSEFVSVAELASQMGVPAKNLIETCFHMGMMVSINQRLEMDTIELLADEYDYTVERIDDIAEELLKEKHKANPVDVVLTSRPPVVTVMGHVDHGKTTFLDFIRKAAVVDTEAGGITQHIGAYSVRLPNGQRMTFIDTPGHKAFTAMRARGAKVTDIVILIVSADDGVMPQTIEAIDHARAANVPIIIAINKIDLPTADPDRIKRELSQRDILVEDWGGSYQCQGISAKFGTNTLELLEKVMLESEMLELRANPDKPASGVVIESHLDKGRGPVATVLIQDGTLHLGDPFVAGTVSGNVRAMSDEKGINLTEAGPSTPLQILGMDAVPHAGDTFYCVDTEVEAREISQQRTILRREQHYRRLKRVSLVDLYDQIKDGTIKELNLIIKGDVDGSVEAVSDSLTQITHEEVRVKVIHSGVGGINENDVLLAAASGSIIIGFHVRPTAHARLLANQENVEIKLYSIIYEAIEDVTKALSGMLSPLVKEKTLGTIEIRDVIKIPKVGNVAGCYVTSGTVKRNNKIRLVRENTEIYTGKISSLKRFKEDVGEVNQGYECGLSLENYSDIKVGDVIEAFELLEEARKL